MIPASYTPVILVVYLLCVCIPLLVTFFLVRAAVVSAMRRARREQWTEKHDIQAASWLHPSQRTSLLAQAHAENWQQLNRDDHTFPSP